MRLPTTDQIQTIAHRSPDPLNIKGRFCDVMGIPADDPASVVPHGRNWRVLGMWGDQPADRRQVIVVAYGTDQDVYRCCKVTDLVNLF